MTPTFDFTKTFLHHWAHSRRVRVAVFGPGASLGEWLSLSTLAWRELRPVVEVTADPREADLLVIEGPLSGASWPALEAWCVAGRPILGVGPDLPVDGDGRLLMAGGVASALKLSGRVGGVVPAPAELRRAALAVLEDFYARH